MSEWEDERYGVEYFKFKDAPPNISTLYTDKVHIGFVAIDYNTILDYTSQWNKPRKRVQVHRIIRAEGTPYDNDTIEYSDNVWLDLGARLFKAIKPFALKKTKYLKILRFSNELNKFDVTFQVSAYKMTKQTKITDKKPKTAKK